MSETDVVYDGPHASGLLETGGQAWEFVKGEPVTLPTEVAKSLGDDWKKHRPTKSTDTKDDES